MYTVSRLGPAARIVPSLSCLVVIVTGLAVDAALLEALAELLLPPPLEDELELLEPQPAAISAVTTAGATIIARTLFTGSSFVRAISPTRTPIAWVPSRGRGGRSVRAPAGSRRERGDRALDHRGELPPAVRRRGSDDHGGRSTAGDKASKLRVADAGRLKVAVPIAGAAVVVGVLVAAVVLRNCRGPGARLGRGSARRRWRRLGRGSARRRWRRRGAGGAC